MLFQKLDRQLPLVTVAKLNSRSTAWPEGCRQAAYLVAGFDTIRQRCVWDRTNPPRTRSSQTPAQTLQTGDFFSTSTAKGQAVSCTFCSDVRYNSIVTSPGPNTKGSPMRRAVLQLQHIYHSSYAACKASTAAGSIRSSSSAGVVDQMLQYVNTDLHVSPVRRPTLC